MYASLRTSLDGAVDNLFSSISGVSIEQYRRLPPIPLNLTAAMRWGFTDIDPDEYLVASKDPIQYNAVLPLQREAYEIGERLLSIDGHYIQIPTTNLPYCGALARYGKLMDPSNVSLQPGRPNWCHDNVIRLYNANSTGWSIAAGFALNFGEHGFWNDHTWLVKRDGTIVETTERRKQYFGVKLTKARAAAFCERHISGDWSHEESWVERMHNRYFPLN
jgi:hypothetical protein